jgi:uncharacterized iron-regulated protein
MEKIKSIKQLNKEKDRLKNRQSELKKLIANDWTDLKTVIKPASIAKRMFEKKTSDDNAADKKNTASAIFSLIAARYVLKLIEKAGGFFRK